ncbi:MAG: AMP-binding protein, partial [Spirochaetia bacterium]
MKKTVLRMLDEAAQKWDTAPYALRKGDEGWIPVSFSEARQKAREFAVWLLGSGAKKGEALAILAEGSPAWIIGEFGLLMAGCVSVPLSIKLLEEEIPFRLNHSEARAILTTRNQLKKV